MISILLLQKLAVASVLIIAAISAITSYQWLSDANRLERLFLAFVSAIAVPGVIVAVCMIILGVVQAIMFLFS